MPINIEYLQEFSGGDIEFIKEMMQTFLDETPGYMDSLLVLDPVEDQVKIREQAHKMKATFQFFGMDHLYAYCLKIESICEGTAQLPNPIEELGATISQLKENFDVVLPEVQQQLNEM